jgi:hypothetical protein
MAKNKDINISPSKGISIIIKNDIQQPPPITPKKKRRYKRINVLPKTPAPIMQQSAGDTSYIKAQPGRFSLWRDTTTATPVLTLAQATSQGFMPQITAPPPQQQITAPPPQQQITGPQQQQQLTGPPINYNNFFDYLRAMMPQEYKSNNQGPQIEDITDLNDTFYQALPEDKKQAYKEVRLEELAKTIDDTATKAVQEAENTDFYKNELDTATQTTTKEKTIYLAIEQKLKNMREGDIKGLGSKDVRAMKEPRYPQNKIYRKAYLEGLSKQEETIKKRIVELDDIISTKTGGKKTRAEAEKMIKENDLKQIETLYNKLKQEKKRIKNLLK